MHCIEGVALAMKNGFSANLLIGIRLLGLEGVWY
jgi:hypothetical protein